MKNQVFGQNETFSMEKLKDIERTILDPDYLILLANALKAERNARIEAETYLKEILSKKEIELENSKNKTVSNVNGSSAGLTIKQAAKRLGVSTKTIERRIKSGEIKAYKFGDGKTAPVRISEEALIEYVNKCAVY